MKVVKSSVLLFSLVKMGGAFAQASFVKPYSGDLSYRNQDFVNNVGGKEGNRYWGNLNFTYDSKEPFKESEGKLDLSMRYNDAKGFMYSVKEAQMTHLWQNSELTYGRVIVDWVEIDKVWGLGKINNRVNFDFFDPGQEGLTGVRYKYNFSKYFMADVFFSYIYVPESNPALKINNSTREITSRNPWAEAPSRTATLEDGSTFDVLYHVNTPKISEVVFQESYGLNLKFSPTEFIHLTAFYLKKPENSLTNRAKLELNNTTFNAEVEVYPESYYHELYGGQLTLKILDKDLLLYASYLASIPGKKPNIDADFEDIDLGIAFDIEKQQEEYFGTGFHWNLTELFSFSAGYLARTSDFVRTSILSKHPRWSQAVNIAASWQIHQRLRASTDIKFDTISHDRLYTFDLTALLTSKLQMSLGFNIIGTSSGEETFWRPFRTNDSVYTSLGYLF